MKVRSALKLEKRPKMQNNVCCHPQRYCVCYAVAFALGEFTSKIPRPFNDFSVQLQDMPEMIKLAGTYEDSISPNPIQFLLLFRVFFRR